MVIFMAFLVPIILSGFFSFAKNLFVPAAVYGISDPHPVKSLSDAFASASKVGKNKVVLINNGYSDGKIGKVLDAVYSEIEKAGHGMEIVKAEQEVSLSTECKSSLRGVSQCYGAVVMRSSPDEGQGGIWNYTIRSDAAWADSPIKIQTDRSDNPEQVYFLPIQRVVDSCIKQIEDPKGSPLADIEEYPFTSLTPEERDERIRKIYHQALVSFMAVAFITSVLWITYHMTGFIATERESGMSQLLDAMMPVSKPWKAQAARIIAHHLSFSTIYAPAWIIGSIIMRQGVFPLSSVGIMLIHHLLTGLALASMSILYASMFKKAQLSGITAVLATLLIGILSQSLTRPHTPPVVVLSLLFTPSSYVYFITLAARFEEEGYATNLVTQPPNSPWHLPGIVFWIFLIIQIFAYPLLGALIENSISGTSTQGRKILKGDHDILQDDAVQLNGFTKIYNPNIFSKIFSRGKASPVVAVDNLSFKAGRGQIIALLGANGSGKSTTLDAIAGLHKLTSGEITIDGTGGLGIAPQKNVLWDDLTVEEHIKIFNRLKAPGNHASKEEMTELIRSVDLYPKRRAQAKTLSGGQKRKLQLGMMLTGGSAVCCVDEVSSGIDPLSRRKIWDILLAERGKRTLILTTHFLDEADLLADQIAILSKGTLRAEGSSVELKDRLGGGYRVHVHKHLDSVKDLPSIEGVKKKDSFDLVTYIAPSSSLAAQVITELENRGVTDYRFSGPTIEDVFLQLAEEIKDEEAFSGTDRALQLQRDHISEDEIVTDKTTHEATVTAQNEGLDLKTGRRIGYLHQSWILFKKRVIILKRNWIPYAIVVILPIAAAGLTSLYIKNQDPSGCSPGSHDSISDTENAFSQISSDHSIGFLVGPSSKYKSINAKELLAPIFGNSTEDRAAEYLFFQNMKFTDTYEDFQAYVSGHRKNITSGLWLGDDTSSGRNATIAWVANLFITSCLTTQQFLDIFQTNISIATTWQPFEVPFAPGTGNSLNLIIYMGIAFSCFPGFFSLYPSNERRRFVRGLQYSNGVRPLPLWMAYLLFDFMFALVVAAVVTAVWAGVSHIWYHIEYVFVVFFLYGIASILFSYVVSLFAKSQLGTFAWTVVIQGVLFLGYLIAYMSIITYAPVNRVDSEILLVHFVLSAVAPIGSAMRAMFLALNLFSVACDGHDLSSNPGSITMYGGPILYLCLQSLILFGMLLYFDSGSVGSIFRRLLPKRTPPVEEPDATDEMLMEEIARVTTSDIKDDTLQVKHLTKSFGRNTAVDNVTFGIQRGQVFALLGPNGAGKSTTISLIRGDMKPSRNGGDVLVQGVSVTKNLANARSHLGVCPQVDAMDQMTVREHLEFYAQVRGVQDVQHNVSAVLRAVGLEAFSTRMAHALSGGNKRKLSLGIALMGNPTVVLLDEPSSGLDAASKRIMWKTLAATVPGRSILLTTHSMEEADALASKAGILARRMLALGTPDGLRQRFGDALHVHLVSSTAPRTTDEEMALVVNFIRSKFPSSTVDEKTYHGQVRFSVSPREVLSATSTSNNNRYHEEDEIKKDGDGSLAQSAIGHLVVLLEQKKQELGIGHYSVSPTTLDQVFLTIVGRHNVKEENYEEEKTRKRKTRRPVFEVV